MSASAGNPDLLEGAALEAAATAAAAAQNDSLPEEDQMGFLVNEETFL